MDFRKLLAMATAIFISDMAMLEAHEVPVVSLAIIAQIESNQNPKAINKKEQAFGMYQIRQCVLTDYNRSHKKQYKLKDMLNVQASTEVAFWMLTIRIPMLLRYIDRPITKEMIIRVWNSGIGTVADDRFPETTRKYIKNYHALETGR